MQQLHELLVLKRPGMALGKELYPVCDSTREETLQRCVLALEIMQRFRGPQVLAASAQYQAADRLRGFVMGDFLKEPYRFYELLESLVEEHYIKKAEYELTPTPKQKAYELYFSRAEQMLRVLNVAAALVSEHSVTGSSSSAKKLAELFMVAVDLTWIDDFTLWENTRRLSLRNMIT